MPKVYIGFPIHSHPTAHFMASFIRLVAEAPKDFVFMYDFKIHISNLPVERCLIAHEALKLEADLLLFIDDDMMFEPTTAVSIMKTALEENAVVAATYRKKEEKLRHVGFTLDQAGRSAETKGTLIGAASVGMGLTAIPMLIVKNIINAAKMGEHDMPFFHSKRFPGEDIAGLFEFRIGKDLAGDQRFLQEDECFCKHVIETGHKIWIDSQFTAGHVGQYVYR